MADFVPAHITVNNYNTVSNKVDSLMTDAPLEFVIDGGGAAITTGEKGHLIVPYHGTLSLIVLVADQPGSIQIDIWRGYLEYFEDNPPTDADSITGDHVPAIVDGRKYSYSTGGWGTGRYLNKYDVLAFNVDSCTDIQRVTIYLTVNRSLTPMRALPD